MAHHHHHHRKHSSSDEEQEFKPPAPRYFFIKSEMNGKVIDVKDESKSAGAEICMWSKHGQSADNQIWYQDAEGAIHSKLSGFVLDASDNKLIKVQPYTGADHQKWVISGNKITRKGDPKRVLDISGESKNDGAHIIEYDYHGTSNQHWQIEYC